MRGKRAGVGGKDLTTETKRRDGDDLLCRVGRPLIVNVSVQGQDFFKVEF